jgi:long-chain acyl-CoA synthetase
MGDVGRCAPVPALMEESFALHPDVCVYLSLGTVLAFGELDRTSRALGAWLQGQGLQRGDRVALMVPK